MPSTIWDQQAALDALKPLLWRYLSASAKLVRHGGMPEDAYLSQDELRRLAASHMSVQVDRDGILDSAERLIRIMPASVQRRRDVLNGYVQGRIDWQRTAQVRLASGDPADPTRFACEIIDRRYDTDLGRLLKATLVAIGQLGTVAGLPDKGGETYESLGQISRRVSRRARALSQEVKLRPVRHVNARTLRNVPELIGRYPEAEYLVGFLRNYIKVFLADQRITLSDVVGSEVFRPDASSTIFELQVGVEVMRSLEEGGFGLKQPVSLLPNSGTPLASFQREGFDASLWWQRNIWDVVGLQAANGAWAKMLRANQLTTMPLRPDLLLYAPSQRRLLVIEVKLTESERGVGTERAGLKDLLAYSADIGGYWAGNLQYLAVGWNAAGGWLSHQQEFLVSSQRDIASTVGNILNFWSTAPQEDRTQSACL